MEVNKGTVNHNLTDTMMFWVALHADGSMSCISSRRVQHINLVGGSWTPTVDPSKGNVNPFVYFFPGEIWPPDSTTQMP